MRLGGLSKKLMAVALSSVMVVSGFAGLAPAVSVSAADDTAKLRMIFTSDLHGQLTTEDYRQGLHDGWFVKNGNIDQESEGRSQCKEFFVI